MTSDNRLATIWKAVKSKARETSETVSYREVDSENVKFGSDTKGNLYLFARAPEGTDLSRDFRSRAIHLKGITLDGCAHLAAICIDEHFYEVFEKLCNDVVPALVEAENPADSLREQIGRWRELFAPSQLLTETALAGIVGELNFLRTLVNEHGTQAYKSWIGPDNQRHDFRGADCAVEVKSSTTATGRRATISSVDQLEPPHSDVELFLKYFQLRNDAEGDSVPSLIDEVVEAGVPLLEILSKLKKVGYVPGNEDQYEQFTFVVQNQFLYNVSENGFPKILRSTFPDGDLPPGVASLTYTIDLTNQPPTPLSAAESKLIEQRVAQT